MRVLIITSHRIIEDTGGTPKHIKKLVSGLQSSDIEVRVIHLSLRSKSLLNSSQQEYQGVQILTIPILKWISESRRAIEAFQPDAFFAFTSGAACRFLPLLWLYRRPLLYEIHTVFTPFSLNPLSLASWQANLYSQLEKLVCKRADHFVALGEAVKTIYQEERGIEEEKISLIYPGVRIEGFDSIKSGQAVFSSKDLGMEDLSTEDFCAKNSSAKDLGAKDLIMNVVYLGNLVYENHGVRYLLEAAKLVCEENRRIHFYLVGKPDNAEEKYRQISFDPDWVTFVYTDEIARIDSILAAADILVHTRTYSRHNLSVQSKFAVYMACGKPVVVTDFADYRSFIDAYQCGYAVSLKPEEIASAILALAENSKVRAEMGCNSAELAERHFDLAKNVDSYVEILEAMVS